MKGGEIYYANLSPVVGSETDNLRMETNRSPDQGAKKDKVIEHLHTFENAHKEDIEAILQVLVRITSRTPEEIRPHLDVMLEHLVEPLIAPFHETATPDEWMRAIREWSESHDRNTPLLSDYAVSRESIYDDERL